MLIGLGTVFAMDVKLTLDTRQMKQELLDSGKLNAIEQETVQEWKALNQDRFVNFAGTLGFFILVFVMVSYVGPQQPKQKRISKRDAAQIMREMKEEYIRQGVYVEASDTEDAENDKIFIDRLDIPELKEAEFKDNHILFTWAEVEHAEGYVIYRRKENEKWVRRATVENVTYYEDYSIAMNTKYIYTVKAYIQNEDEKLYSKKNPLGKSAVSQINNLLDIPNISPVKENGIKGVRWTPVEGCKVYRIYRRQKDEKWKIIAKVNANSDLIFYDRQNKSNKEYKYTVSACYLINNHPVVGEYDNIGV